MPQIVVEITKTGPGVSQAGETTRQSVSVGQGNIRLRCSNGVCNRRGLSIDISSTIESMIDAGEIQKEWTECCSGVQRPLRGLHAHSCGTTYHIKITIQP